MADVAVKDNKNKKSFFTKMKKYFKETKSELKKVTWPSAEQLKQNTAVIVVFIILIGIFLFVFDLGFAKLTSLLPSL